MLEKKYDRRGAFSNRVANALITVAALYAGNFLNYDRPRFEELTPKVQTVIKEELNSLPSLLTEVKKAIEAEDFNGAENLLNDVDKITTWLYKYDLFKGDKNYADLVAQIEVYRTLIKDAKDLRSKEYELEKASEALKNRIK